MSDDGDEPSEGNCHLSYFCLTSNYDSWLVGNLHSKFIKYKFTNAAF